MLKGLDIQQLAAKIHANQGLKRDYIVDTRTLAMHVHEDNKLAITIPDEGDSKGGDFPLLPLAHDQLASRLKIPAQYYDRMKSAEPALLAHNVNTWLRHTPERRMVRTLGGDMRSYNSNKYQRIENEQIAAATLPVLHDLPGVKITSAEVTDRRLYIHFVLPSVEGEVKKGDIVQAGGIIQNSEVGLGAASVSGLLWRLICLNGMKTSEAYRKAHVGRAVEEAGELEWSDDTRRADDRTVLLKVRDMVRAVVDESRFKVNLNKMRGLTEGQLTGDPVKAVEVLAQKVGANDTETNSILQSLIKGGDLSAWGLLNAVTAQGHNAKDYDRAVEFEAAGGRLLELPASEWREVLQAA